MIRVGVIGYGYWGPNVVRNFAEALGCQIAAVSDLRPERLALARSAFEPGTQGAWIGGARPAGEGKGPMAAVSVRSIRRFVVSSHAKRFNGHRSLTG